MGYRLGSGHGDTELVVEGDGARHEFALLDLGPDAVRIRHDGVDIAVPVAIHADGSVWVNDSAAQSRWHQRPRLPEAMPAGAAAAGPVSEMPGTVVAVLVAAGRAGDGGPDARGGRGHEDGAPRLAAADGVVDEVHVEVGQYVEANTLLVAIAVTEATA